MRWIDRSEGVLSALRVLHQYLQDGPRVCLTSRYMLRARRLLGAHGMGGTWRIDLIDWEERLRLAGIDPETLEVADEVRWAHAIDYMRATETFKLEEFKQWLLDHEEPSHVPAIDVPARPHPRARKKVTENRVDARINERIREKTT